MNELLFAFHDTDILLTAAGEIPQGTRLPQDIRTWELVTKLNEPVEEGLPESGQICCRLYTLGLSPIVPSNWQLVPLRQALAMLSPRLRQLAGKAAELVHWHTHTRYCSVCGSSMRWSANNSKQCPKCGEEQWPHIHTAIIVRITRSVELADGRQREEILMVRARNFRGNHYGLVAGFLEAGETLEACVRREVWEETGLQIKDLRYHSSQAWPFPSQLMVAFTARYASGTLHLQQSELADGGWFDANHLPPLPNHPSVARQLVEEWLER